MMMMMHGADCASFRPSIRKTQTGKSMHSGKTQELQPHLFAVYSCTLVAICQLEFLYEYIDI